MKKTVREVIAEDESFIKIRSSVEQLQQTVGNKQKWDDGLLSDEAHSIYETQVVLSLPRFFQQELKRFCQVQPLFLAMDLGKKSKGSIDFEKDAVVTESYSLSVQELFDILRCGKHNISVHFFLICAVIFHSQHFFTSCQRRICYALARFEDLELTMSLEASRSPKVAELEKRFSNLLSLNSKRAKEEAEQLVEEFSTNTEVTACPAAESLLEFIKKSNASQAFTYSHISTTARNIRKLRDSDRQTFNVSHLICCVLTVP
jgi:hypothetical protein